VTLLGGGTLSSFFDAATTLETVRIDLQSHIQDLSGLKNNLENNKDIAEGKRKELANLNTSLTQQNQSLTIARSEQNKLLAQTKNQESVYQAQISQKKALEAKFESDLLNYENQLNLIVNPGSFAKPGTGVLQWPVASPYITQYFGNTPFATANAQVYGGKGHNAIDLRASPGTPIMAARAGTVRGTGNTDITCPGASYGKWIFIDHDNGLSTLYAHLSTYIVSKGDRVSAGQVIGYSDTTGYATGPHLHFGVYASSGSEIATFPSKSCAGKNYTMPVADVSAYLNPLSYLPAI
jgi:murein DD-endopeptidase MepM/ murein hydrolase activator NlpD